MSRHETAIVLLASSSLLSMATACGSDWIDAPCTADEQAFIAEAVERADDAAVGADDALEQAVGPDHVPFADVVAVLRDLHGAGEILCGTPVEQAEGYTTAAEVGPGGDQILINVEADRFVMAMDRWSGARYLEDYACDELIDVIAGCSVEDYAALRLDARSTVIEPGWPAVSLVHEAFHIAGHIDHADDEITLVEDPTLSDQILESEPALRSAIYWDLWIPWRNQLDDLYTGSHPGGGS